MVGVDEKSKFEDMDTLTEFPLPWSMVPVAFDPVNLDHVAQLMTSHGAALFLSGLFFVLKDRFPFFSKAPGFSLPGTTG